ncbi:MAG: asparagine synthase (glutamine-hydrolyzing), partial [Flavobacterium sp.]
MCGIAGHISFHSKPVVREVENLITRINHRGPDDHGTWSSSDGICVLGHARLSIIDLTPLGHQPMYDGKTGNCIAFNGEIYNFKELRKECERQGETFTSQSDTEVLLALYRLYGVDCLPKLRGMFAFALWDASKKRLFIARDRVGKKPLNYALTSKGLMFCSEIDPLSRHPEVSREKDSEALELYLQQQTIPAPWTIYKQIRKLKPAHYAIYNENGFQTKQYWNVNYTEKVKISEQEALEEFENKLTEAVRLRMISDVPIGALLSGGVDSSVVVALMAKLNGEKVNTFSVGFENERFNELPFARQVAGKFGTNHYPEIAKGNVEDLLPLLVKHYGEPYADSSAVPSFMVAQCARKHVTVVMNGDGGDELLGGYSRYALTPFQMKVSPWLGKLISDEKAAKLGVSLLGNKRSAPVKSGQRLLNECLRPELTSLTMFDNSGRRHSRPRLLNQNNNAALLPEWRGEWYKNACKNADHPIDRMLWYDNRTYLPDDLLVKMDIASMHCGLETRSPLLDHEVIEFCASLPVGFKNHNGTTKYLLKKLAEKYFPKEFIYRKKMGFGIPMAEWMRGPLKEMVLDTLSSPQLMAPMNMAVVNKTVADFMKGENGYKDRVWV